MVLHPVFLTITFDNLHHHQHHHPYPLHHHHHALGIRKQACKFTVIETDFEQFDKKNQTITLLKSRPFTMFCKLSNLLNCKFFGSTGFPNFRPITTERCLAILCIFILECRCSSAPKKLTD